MFITGGPDLDLYQVGTGDTNKIAGPVTINSPDIDNDYASYNDSLAPVGRRYQLTANPLDPSGTTVGRTGLSPVNFNGLVQMNFLSPRIGGNRLDIQGSAASTVNLAASNTDRVTMGSLSPTPGGTLSGLGPFSLQSYNTSDVDSVVMDDSGNNAVARDVTIEPYQATGGIVSGFGLPSITFTDSANFSFDLRGGGADDSFIMRGRPLAARFRIDGVRVTTFSSLAVATRCWVDRAMICWSPVRWPVCLMEELVKTFSSAEQSSTLRSLIWMPSARSGREAAPMTCECRSSGEPYCPIPKSQAMVGKIR